MCFSAEASFIASAILGVTGIATLKSASRRAHLWLASVPLLFAIQQFNEGVLWLNMPIGPETPWFAIAAQYVFMFFAYLFWPVFVPLALFIAEANPLRKKIIGASLAAGIAMIVYFIWNFVNSEGAVTVTIFGHSLYYSANDPLWRVIYPLIVLVPCFASSLRWMKLFGVLIALSVLISEYYFTAVFVSVWCFFAAIISLVLFGVIRVNRR